MKNSILAFVCIALALFSCTKEQFEESLTTSNLVESNLEPRSSPSITSIGGGTIAPYFSNGKWLGNIPSCGQGNYYGYYVINTIDATESQNYWLINGSNFGTTKGSLSLNASGITLTILSWSSTQIKVRPTSSYTLDYKTNIQLKVTTSTGSSVSKLINILGMIKAGRGYGQCTWEVGYQRLLAGLTIPSTAFYSKGAITNKYVPKKYHIVHFLSGNIKHTAIIISVPTVSTSNGITTYTFQLRERNENCNETYASQTTKTFKVNSTSIVAGIKSNNANLGSATDYFY